jgi:hypothetical protein
MSKRTCSIGISAAIASLIAFAPQASAKPASSVTVAQEAQDTLKEMKGIAATAAGEASRLEKLSENSVIDSEVHRDALWSLRRDVNTMGQEIAGLEARRESLEPWEREAVDKVLPLLKEAAASTQSAIEYYNENRNRLWSPEYRALTEKISHDSDQIARTLKNYLKYEKVREEEQQLQSTIESGAN